MTSVTSRELEKAFQEDSNAEVTVIKGNRHYYVSFQGTTRITGFLRSLKILFYIILYVSIWLFYFYRYVSKKPQTTTQRGGCADDHALCLSMRWRLSCPVTDPHTQTHTVYVQEDWRSNYELLLKFCDTFQFIIWGYINEMQMLWLKY